MKRPARTPAPPGFGTIWVTVALDLVGFGIVFPILPIYAHRFGADAVSATGMVAVFSAAQLLFAPVWGRLSDRIGRKPVLIVSLVGTAIGSLVTGLAGSVAILYLGRVIDGISGGSVSVAQAAVADIAAPEQRARLLGLVGAAFGVGFVAGPALGALSALGGPRVPFLVAAVIAAVNALVASRRLPETRPETQPHAPRPLFDRQAWLEERVLPLVFTAFLSLSAFSAFEATFPFFGEVRLHFGEVSTAATFAAIGLPLLVVQARLIGPAVDRLGERAVLVAGLVCNAAGLFLLASVHSVAALIAPMALLVVGQGLASPTMTSMVAGRAGGHRRGAVLGVQQAAGGLARVVGPIAGGLLFKHIGVPAPYLTGGAVMVAAALLAGMTTGEVRTGRRDSGTVVTDQ
ncbi:MAG: MFS transporter [Actinobacteria bacterium]|nr:MFS transporter [Actinomycetota bacterium]